MNIIKANEKEFKVIDGGVNVSDVEAKFTLEVEEGVTLEAIETDFTEAAEDVIIYDMDGETEVAVYKGYNSLVSVKKNVEDGTIEVCLKKNAIEDRVKELENAVDTLTASMLGE